MLYKEMRSGRDRQNTNAPLLILYHSIAFSRDDPPGQVGRAFSVTDLRQCRTMKGFSSKCEQSAVAWQPGYFCTLRSTTFAPTSNGFCLLVGAVFDTHRGIFLSPLWPSSCSLALLSVAQVGSPFFCRVSCYLVFPHH